MRGFLPFICAGRSGAITIRAPRAPVRVRREDAAIAERAAILAELRADRDEDVHETHTDMLDLLEHDLATL